MTGMSRALRAIEHRREVLLEVVDRQSAQSVVGAERDNQHAHVALERPVEPPQSARGRVTGDAGVDDS